MRLGSFQNLYLSFAIVEITHGVTANRENYYTQQFDKEKNNIKNTWKIINSVLKSNTSSKTSSINVDIQSINNPLLIVEHYNDYFTNIGPKLANQIPQCDINFQDYLRNPNPRSIFFAPVTEQELISIVFNLPNKKSSGYDSINNLVIK